MLKPLRPLLFLVLLAASGCASVYFPAPPPASLLTQKGEFYGGISTNQRGNFAVQGAYAFADHVAAAGTFSSYHNNRKRRTENYDFGEAALGYFTRLPDRRVLEIYGGLGAGRTQRLDRPDEDTPTVPGTKLDGSLTKFFVQVNYAKKKQRPVHLFGRDLPLSYGAAWRLSHVQLTNFKINGQLQDPATNVFFEPITFTRLHLTGPLQLQLMSGQNIGLKRNKYLKAANSVFQVGLIINLGGQATE
ncbi:hypothetical protein [uncultured Hymenobacter sp.]|uniref:hypothetical protein n=1 Tax=uncultured Hymenobacter sp. TaxID=170016 RepID=UPI0035CA1256